MKEQGHKKISDAPIFAAHIEACVNKIAFLYEGLDRTFKELMWELSAAKDPDTYEAYKNKVTSNLMALANHDSLLTN